MGNTVRSFSALGTRNSEEKAEQGKLGDALGKLSEEDRLGDFLAKRSADDGVDSSEVVRELREDV